MKPKSLSLAWLYPDLMSTYGDRGNVIALQERCRWRDIPIEVKKITLETPVSELQVCDLIFMGGAQDRQQKLAGSDFLNHKGPILREMVEAGVPGLFVCAAYQAVGRYYQPYQGQPIPGPGIFDLTTRHPGDQAKRLIGNVAAELIEPSELQGKMIVGFENHGGRTRLGPALKPLARVIAGSGNNGEDGYEGARYRNALGSYLHGPLLPKNPHLADWLIQKALEVKYQESIELSPLDDEDELRAQRAILARLNIHPHENAAARSADRTDSDKTSIPANSRPRNGEGRGRRPRPS